MHGFVSSIQKRKRGFASWRLCDDYFATLRGNFKRCFVDFPTFPPQSWNIFYSAFSLCESRDNRRERDVFAFWNVAIVLRASFEFSRRYISFLTFSNLDIFYIRRQPNIRLPFSGVIGEKLNAILLFYINKTLKIFFRLFKFLEKMLKDPVRSKGEAILRSILSEWNV